MHGWRRPRPLRYGRRMEPSVLIALVAVAVVGGIVAGRLQRSAKRGRAEGTESPLAEVPAERISASDQRFRLLSFQGGPVPADLGRMVEELRRNGIEVDEATLRQKLAEETAPITQMRGGADGETAGTAIVLAATDVPGGMGPAPNTVQVQLILELRLPDVESIREQRVVTVTDDKRSLLKEGAAIPVRYEPENPQRITLEWEIT